MGRKYKQDIIEVGREMYDRGLLNGTGGNMSIRISDEEIMITASGVCKGKLENDLITLTDMEGNVKNGPKPARDIKMHLEIYKNCKDAGAVVHAHPPAVTGYAMSNRVPEGVVLPEILLTMGNVAYSRYATPTTQEVPSEIARIFQADKKAGAIILANHGAVTWGKDIFEAYYKMQTLEMYVKALAVAKIFGDLRVLTQEQEEQIEKMLEE